MGASLSWYAVRGRSPEAVLQDFKLKPAGPGYHKTPFSAGPMPNGWFIVHRGRHEFTPAEVQKLSRGGEAVACFLEEHVMVCRASAYVDGRQIWSVTHDAQEGGDHLEVVGTPPAAFAAIRDRLTAQQEEDEDENVDHIFSVPVQLAAEITGYDYDNPPETTLEFYLGPTLFQRLFGG